MKEEIEYKIEELFDEQIPDLPEEKLENLRAMVRNKPRRRKTNLVLKYAMICVCMILVIVPCIVLPIALNKDETPPSTKYYTDITAEQKELDYDYTKTFIDTNYPQYSFMFNVCEYNQSRGYYDENETMLAIRILLTKIDIPNTSVSFVLILEENFSYDEHDLYVTSAELIETENYELYTRTISSFYNETIYGLFYFEDYRLYLNVNKGDSDLFESFYINL